MKILFWGDTAGDSGPANVNKALIKNLVDPFLYLYSRESLISIVWKCLRSDVTVISGVSRKGCLLAFLAKKTVYLMHGCAAREVAAEGLDGKHALWQERYLLKKADLLLCVSEGFRAWVCSAYPQYAHKTDTLYPCADFREITAQKIPGSVIAAGGDSAIKNNAVLSQAVQMLGGKARLEIYGPLRREAAKAPYCGPVSHEEFLQKLARAEIFVLNSLFETFSLTVMEALNCGCSVLVTEAAGVGEVLALQETDLIHDPMGAAEIQGKLSYLQKYPNNQRLLAGLNWESLSPRCCIQDLEEKCASLLEEKP